MIFDLLCIPLNFLEANSNESTWINMNKHALHYYKVLKSPLASFAWMLLLTVYPHVSPKSLHRNCPGAEGMRHGLCLSWEQHIRTTLELGVNILTCLLHGNLYAAHKWVGPHILIAYDCITKHISIWYGSSWKLMVSLWIGQATVIGKTFNVCLQHFPLVDKHSKTYQIKIKKSMISWLHILIFSGKDQCSLWNDCESFCAIFRRLQTRTKRKTPWHDAKHC